MIKVPDKFYVNGYPYAVYVRPWHIDKDAVDDEYTEYVKDHEEYVTLRFDYVNDFSDLDLTEDILATFIILAHDAGVDMSVSESYLIFDECGWCDGVEGIEQPDENGDRFMDDYWHDAESEYSMVAVCKILKRHGI